MSFYDSRYYKSAKEDEIRSKAQRGRLSRTDAERKLTDEGLEHASNAWRVAMDTDEDLSDDAISVAAYAAMRQVLLALLYDEKRP